MGKSTQIFTTIKYQKKILNTFAYYFLEECKYVVKENKRKFPRILIEKILMNKILMKKIKK